MKWIKTFEELTPKIYRIAGQNLMNIPHKIEKGRKLKDYGSEKEWGVYNIELVKNYSDMTREVKFTKPKAKFILNHKVTPDNINDMNTKYEDISVEEMLDLWRDGERELYFTIQFYFEPLEETKSRVGSSLPGWGDVPLFSFKVDLSSWEDSLEQYNTPDEYEDDIENFKTYTLQELYDETSSLSISLALPQSDPRNSWSNAGSRTQIYHYGIFSDRNSAFKFKKLLPTLIEDEVIEKIWEVFSLLGDSKNFQRCIHALKYGVKINHLYDDVKSMSGTNDLRNPNKWFRWNIADIPREVPKKEEPKKEEIKEEPKQLEEPKEEPKSMWYQSRT